MTLAASHVTSTLAQQRIEVIAIAVGICAVIFELVRRKHLMERYAILWLATGATLLLLALWKGLLTKLAHAAGIHYLPSALFAVAFVFVLVMLVHASITISRLSSETTTLAQRTALMQQRLDQLGASAQAASGAELPSVSNAAGETAEELGSAPVRLLRDSSADPQLGAERRKLDRRAS
jgi:hypothetical protein